MKILLFLVAASCLLVAPAQTEPQQELAQGAPTANQPEAPKSPDEKEQPDRQADRSALAVKPGPPAIQQKDLYEGTGYFRPFLRMPKYILQDQKAIWTTPAHSKKSDIKWWAIFGTATAALIATDQWSVKVLPNNSSQVSVSTWASRFGSAYFLIPLGSAFYFGGTAKHEERFRETGLIGFEALVDATLV